MMACAEHGSLMGVSWHSGFAPAHSIGAPIFAAPIFASNDNGDLDYRAVTAATIRLWRNYGFEAMTIAAQRAQGAFWQGNMASCRWWHSVARMLDRALVAGQALAPHPDPFSGGVRITHGPANA